MEHVWEVEHVRRAALDMLVELWVGTHCEFGGEKCGFARGNNVEGLAFYTIVPWFPCVGTDQKSERSRDQPQV